MDCGREFYLRRTTITGVGASVAADAWFWGQTLTPNP